MPRHHGCPADADLPDYGTGKDEVYRLYSERVGDIIAGEVHHQILKRELLILDDATGNELVLPRQK